MYSPTQPTDRTNSRTVPRAIAPIADAGTTRSGRVLQLIFPAFLAFSKWTVITLLVVLAALLVLISLRWGPMHIAVAGLLAVIWLGLLVLLVLGMSRFHSGRVVLATTIGFLVLSPVTVVISQLSAYTPPIVDAQGNPVPGSIATLEQVEINGTRQWISIRATSTDKPVLLWLAGGPGGSQVSTVRWHLGTLEEHFVVVNWEQPGGGKSYHAVNHAELTPERYITDGIQLVNYLRQRFGEEKVYLIGESWGSALGVWMVQRHPELFHTFVGTGQMVDFIETDVFDYHFAMNLARSRGDTAKLDKLNAQGPPPYSGDSVLWKQSVYLLDGFAYMNSDPNISANGFNTFRDLLSPEYGLYDKLNWARGVLDAGNVMFPQLWKADVDFRQDAPVLNVPVYFLIGRHDVNAPPALAEEYYRILDAPHKAWVWFEHSGHNPWVTESDRFVDVVVNQVLAETQQVR